MNLIEPYFPFYELPDVAALANDPSVNVPLNATDHFRGQGFVPLRSSGLTEQALAVMLDMAQLTVVVEAYSQYTLYNANLVGLISRRNAIHHRLLSLPSGPMIAESSDMPHALSHTLYEVCRLGALIYASAIFYVLPPSTGCPRRLVLWVQRVTRDVSYEDLNGGEVKCFIWALFLAGIAAEDMPERPWFVERLRRLLALASVSRWSEIKRVVVLFLWSNSVCDEGGMNLWDIVASDLRNPGNNDFED
jgi:hypothetical protein